MTLVVNSSNNFLLNNAALIKAALLFVLSIFISACSQEPNYRQIDLSGQTMGTTWSAKVILLDNSELDHSALQKKIEQQLINFNQIVSTYIPESGISRFNKSQSLEAIATDIELVNLVEVSKLIHTQSEGLFDITVGPLVSLWGFAGTDFDLDRIPASDEIAEAKAKVGSGKLNVNLVSSQLQKQQPGIEINLSAIAKGRGVDLIAETLSAHNLHNYMVEIGGEIRAHGINSKGKRWQIAIEEPLANQRSIQRVVGLDNIAIATSGDYRNFFEINGQRYSHSIDPNTGWPVKHELVSVTVLHPQAMLADAWATALLVAGPSKAMQLANTNKLAVLLIERTPSGFKEQINELFTAKIQAAQQRESL